MIKVTSLLVLLTIVYGFELSGQNKALSDSLIGVINLDTLSIKSKFEIVRQIAHEHPDADEAMRYADLAISLAFELSDSLDIARAYEEKSANERLVGNNTQSLDYALRALRIFEGLKDVERVASSYAQLGANAVNTGQYDQAVNFMTQAKGKYLAMGDSLRYMLSIINLGEAYRLSNQPDSAVYNFNNALKINESFKNQIIEGYARGNLGMALRSKGDLRAAKVELDPAIEILTELGDPYSVSVYTAELAHINLADGRSGLAEEQFLEAFNMAREEGLKEQIRNFSEMLVSFYEDRSDYARALDYQKIYQVYQDSLVNKENVQQQERLKANYEIDKREGEISLLSRINANQQNFNIALGCGILIFGVLAVMLYQSNRQKLEANTMLSRQQLMVIKREEEKALLLKELNHRVKNNLQMVSSLLSLQGHQLEGHPAADAINAGKSRVEALSLIHQKLYQDDVHTTVNIQEYLDQLVSNLFYSFGDPFKPDLQIAITEMDIDTAIPISLIVNELVTNALKYAYEGIAEPEMIISLNRPGDQYFLEISDNGTGIDENKDTSNSFGLKLVKSLVNQLDGTLEIKKIATGGVAWEIIIPIQQD